MKKQGWNLDWLTDNGCNDYSNHHNENYPHLKEWNKNNTLSYGNQGPVVRRPISANPGLNFNLRFFIPSLKSLFGKIFSVLFKASSSHTLNKKNSTEFSCKAFRSEIGFHTNPGLS